MVWHVLKKYVFGCLKFAWGVAQWTTRAKTKNGISAPRPPRNVILVSKLRKSCGHRGMKVISLNRKLNSDQFIFSLNRNQAYGSKVLMILSFWTQSYGHRGMDVISSSRQLNSDQFTFL